MATARPWLPTTVRHQRSPRALLRRLLAACFALAAKDEPPAAAHEVAEAEQPLAAPLTFETFFREHEQRIFGYLWRMTGDEQAAYDLSQEAFLRAWRHFDRISAYDLPGGWLYRVATNLALKHLRHRRVVAGLVVTSLEAEATAPDAASDPATPDPAVRLADDDLVRDALLDLAPRPRAVLVLHDVYGFTSTEIAATLSMTYAAVKMMLSRAREQFRARYLLRDAHDDGQDGRP